MDKLTLKHKKFGEGEVIRIEGDNVTVKFYNDGLEKQYSLSQSFGCGPFEVSESLQKEIDAMVAKQTVKREKEDDKMHARVERVMERAAVRPTHTKNRSRRTPIKIDLTGDFEQDFHSYLKAAKYQEKTEKGSKSTMYSYENAVVDVLERENMDWATLASDITRIVALYGEGGAKEDIGEKSNKTWINALRRFEDFVNDNLVKSTVTP